MVEFEVIRPLTSGGMAELYLVKLASGQNAVTKQLLPHYANNQDCQSMLRHEAFLGQTLKHPHLVRCIDVVDHPLTRAPVLLFDLVPGNSLACVLDAVLKERRRFKLPRALEVVLQAAETLHYIHGASDASGPLSVVHRDICPANLMVGETLKIIDFGVAFSQKLRINLATAPGRIFYMAPEQQHGQPAHPIADVFSLGVVFFELVTGSRFYGSNDKFRALALLSADAHPDPRERWPGCPTDLADIIMAATHPRPMQRIASADELAAAIRATI